MNTGPGERREGAGAVPTIEDELAAAMAEFAGRERPPYIDADALARAAGRRSRRTAGFAAVAAVAAAVVAVVVTTGGTDGARPAPPARPTVTATPTPAPTTPATDPSAMYGDAGDIYPDVRELLTAAMRYEDPTTRGSVDLTPLPGLFSHHQTFTDSWHGGEGLTCGQRADGMLFSSLDDIRFYRGTTPLPGRMVVELDKVTNKILITGCQHSGGPASIDPAVSGRYGPLVTTGRGSADCGRPTPRIWVADEPAAGTTLHGWTVRFDDGKPFKVSIDGGGKVTPYQCDGT
ncbi:hypothetical protein ABZ901_09420 [Actinacidiphila alni]|uniref:hypothetical protein n=1 Tax=Actinacidiphila alni TaxID=380248 RepID=UPI0033F97836